MKTIYISGQMTGMDDMNFKYFFHRQVELEKLGWKVINPAENDLRKMLNSNWRYTEDQWDEVIEEDCEMIRKEADALFLLEGWEFSKGAKREFLVAIEEGLEFYYEGESV